MNNDLLDRFLEYVKIDTQSDPTSDKIPSTTKQLELIELLKGQLKDFNLEPVIDKYGYLSVVLPNNTTRDDIPKIGFLAHVDTSPDYSGRDVKPQIYENYQGQDIVFASNEVFSPKQFNELNDYLNQTIITTDGTTLLGSDDKAGVAIIMEAVKYLMENQDIEHGDIFIAFTLDEEIGTGIDTFDLTNFKPDFAYTIDGGPIGELNYETFNAAGLKITFKGLNVHPGSAYNVMVNSMELAHEFHSRLPYYDKPEYTKDYEGFFMLNGIEGNVEKTTMSYIIRDHNYEVFKYRKEFIERIIKQMKEKHENLEVSYEMKDQYYNMKEKILEKEIAIDLARDAMKLNDIKPDIIPIRGGTDGSKLSFEGIPCPNIFTGGHNFHGKYEFTCLESMEKARDVILTIIKEGTKKASN